MPELRIDRSVGVVCDSGPHIAQGKHRLEASVTDSAGRKVIFTASAEIVHCRTSRRSVVRLIPTIRHARRCEMPIERHMAGRSEAAASRDSGILQQAHNLLRRTPLPPDS